MSPTYGFGSPHLCPVKKRDKQKTLSGYAFYHWLHKNKAAQLPPSVPVPSLLVWYYSLPMFRRLLPELKTFSLISGSDTECGFEIKARQVRRFKIRWPKVFFFKINNGIAGSLPCRISRHRLLTFSATRTLWPLPKKNRERGIGGCCLRGRCRVGSHGAGLSAQAQQMQ
ncbi:MAG: hypothetical protein IPM82_22115 [Saprospiraceae bacterium]|nr:hypothetical protein [Saprospiraceae bacterium]